MGKVGRFARVVVLAGLAGALTAGKVPPEGFPCGLPENQPEFVFGFYINQVAGAFPLDEGTCEKFTNGAVAACHKAVADSAACLGRVVDNLLKGMKTICSTTDDPKVCVDGAKSQNQGYQMEIEASAQDGDEVCEDEFAEAIFDDCIGAAMPASGN
jgi:hypothetical protein